MLSIFRQQVSRCTRVTSTPVSAIHSQRRTFLSSPTLSEQVAQVELKSPIDESRSVSRIEKLMALGDELSKTATSHAPPGMRNPASWTRRKEKRAPKEGLKPLPKTRRMQDSYVELLLEFSKDEALRERYVGGNTPVRMGQLMEDFDSIAGAAAYRHVLPDGVSPLDAADYELYLVTAAVDRLDMLRPLTDSFGNVPDLRISGHVAFAAASSLEVFLRLSTLPTPTTPAQTIILGRFAMACRSTKGGKHPIAQLVCEGEQEEELLEMGREMREGKKQRRTSSLEKTPPNAEEAVMMHNLFVGRADIYKRNAATPKNVVWMSDTKLNSASIMHPQARNLHNKIFGGHLMRLAYETAYSTACLFAQSPVEFISLDELHFALPVEIGSLLHLDSKVTFAPIRGEHKSFHVSVEAATTNLHTSEKLITNTFHFTFQSTKSLERYVLPRSYLQAMSWLDAQRRRHVGIEIRRGYDSI